MSIERAPPNSTGRKVRIIGLRFASTREEVLDSLWPDHDPTSALNSLNQTVFFLRRVFEPTFRDDTSPGYVGQDGETIWLDTDLVDCRSRRCLE